MVFLSGLRKYNWAAANSIPSMGETSKDICNQVERIYPAARYRGLNKVPGGSDSGGEGGGGGGGVEGHRQSQDLRHQHVNLGGEEEEEKAGKDLSDDKEEEEKGEGVGEGGGGAAGGDQAQGPRQKEYATWNQVSSIQNISQGSVELRRQGYLRLKRQWQVFQGLHLSTD